MPNCKRTDLKDWVLLPWEEWPEVYKVISNNYGGAFYPIKFLREGLYSLSGFPHIEEHPLWFKKGETLYANIEDFSIVNIS